MSPRAIGAFAVACVAASLAAAQTTHTVGPGGFPTIGAAIAAAAPGDTVVVGAGVHAPFTLDKGLTLTAAPGALVRVGNLGLLLATTRFAIPAGQRAQVAGIEFRNQVPFAFVQRVVVDGGAIQFSDCLFEGHTGTPEDALTVRSSDVVLERCVVAGGGRLISSRQSGAGGNGLVVERSRLAASGCLFAGGHLNWDFIGSGGAGLVADTSLVHLAHCVAIGGSNDYINPGWPPGNAILVRPASTVWLADCLVLGGHGNANTGAAALVNLGASPVAIARSRLGGGSGATPGNGSTGPVAAAPLLGAFAPAPLVRGATWRAEFTAAPGTPVVAAFSTTLTAGHDPRVVQPVWCPGGSPLAFVGTTDAAGSARYRIAVPNDPALLHRSLWLHSFAVAPLPLESAPPLGGVIR